MFDLAEGGITRERASPALMLEPELSRRLFVNLMSAMTFAEMISRDAEGALRIREPHSPSNGSQAQ